MCIRDSTNSPELPLYDAILRDSLSATLNVELNDERWNQASLPVTWGGLGVHSIVLLAPSAYLASATNTAGRTLFPARLRDIKNSRIDAAMSATTPATRSIMPGTADVFITNAFRGAYQMPWLTITKMSFVRWHCLCHLGNGPYENCKFCVIHSQASRIRSPPKVDHFKCSM